MHLWWDDKNDYLLLVEELSNIHNNVAKLTVLLCVGWIEMSISGEGFFDKLREMRLDKIVSEHGNTEENTQLVKDLPGEHSYQDTHWHCDWGSNVTITWRWGTFSRDIFHEWSLFGLGRGDQTWPGRRVRLRINPHDRTLSTFCSWLRDTRFCPSALCSSSGCQEETAS